MAASIWTVSAAAKANLEDVTNRLFRIAEEVRRGTADTKTAEELRALGALINTITQKMKFRSESK